MIPTDKLQRFIEDFPDIHVGVDEVGNFEIHPHDTDRLVMMGPSWLGWEATDLRYSLVERTSEKYGRYDFNPFTQELKTISFVGQPPINETIALAQRGSLPYRHTGSYRKKSSSEVRT